jgi:signal transduction histidine kinase
MERALELERVLARLAEAARLVVQADAAAVYMLDEDAAHLKMAASCGLPDPRSPCEPDEVERRPLDKQALAGRPIVIADARADPRAVNLPGDYCSVLCMPLACEGESFGTLHAYATSPRSFNDEVIIRLTPLADLGAMAIAATRALKAAEVSEAGKARFIQVATHELRAPVGVAQSLVRGVLKGYAGALTEKQSDVFERISRRLDGLESLINDLLDLAAGKAPQLAEREGPVLLNASIGRVVVLLQPRAEEKGLSMRLELCRDQLIVWGTDEGLDRIFVNLVSNAVKYTPSGGSVTVTVRCLPGQAQVEVADTGIGIPEEALAHLFEEFYRAPNAKKLDETGTGLGLAIVKDLVERYKGRIEVKSAVGQGSVFTVTFPLSGPVKQSGV